MLTLVRRLLELRRHEPALHGAYAPLRNQGKALIYSRGRERGALFVALNFSKSAAAIDVPAREIVLSTALDREGEVTMPFFLRPNEGVLLRA